MATPSTSTGGSAAAGSQTDAESVTHIQMAGLTVLMIKTKDQVIYKLPDNMSVQSLSKEQRERLLAEINLLHHQQTTAQAIAATQAQTQQVQMAQAQAQQAQGVRPIAPLSINTNGSASASAASTPPASTSLRSSPSAPSTPTGGSVSDHKTTRRYNKTGKYSKKKTQSLQESEARGIRSNIAGGTSNGQPYARPPDKSKPQSLVFNNTNPQAYQALAAASQQQQASTSALTAIPSSILQQQIQQQQASGLSTVDQKRQFKLLQEIHQLQQQLEVQQSSINTFREHEKTVQRVLAQNKPVDARTQQLARQNVVDAEKALETLKGQLRDKEASFREQFPIASQQLLLLQQQQLQAASKNGSGSAPLSLSAKSLLASNAPKTVEEQLQQQIAEHHDSVRNGMAEAIQTNHKELKRPDYRTPFSSLDDAIGRLLPFHIYQYPPQDIDAQAKAFANRPEMELNARALLIHKRKYDLYNRYHSLIKTNATKPTTTNPSNALNIMALRFGLEDEQEEHKKVSEELELVKIQAKVIQEELERRQLQVLQQRKAEAVLIEQQQKLMLERQRQEELEKKQLEQQQEQMVAQIRQMQELQQMQRLEEMQEMQLHLQQQQESQLTEEQEEARRKEEVRKELERQHQLELEKQMRIKQEQMLKEAESAQNAAAAAAAAVAALRAVATATPPASGTEVLSAPGSSGSGTVIPSLTSASAPAPATTTSTTASTVTPAPNSPST
ncbi:hypothetical protein BGX21_008797 [Mortierella sp. AD011]|nr:hypothetical protein BGX20_006554 [Mortierella sp. AD010]KAF9397501.1 hypothetical protein BGX21_008797 [Mortierella sp. AD011]